MSKKSLKIVTAILTFAMIMTISFSVFAIKPDDIKPNPSSNVSNSIKNVSGSVLGILQTVGVAVAVIILIVLGIKYMMGSASEKAEYKKTMIPYLIGAIFIFAAPTIANIVYELAIGLGK